MYHLLTTNTAHKVVQHKWVLLCIYLNVFNFFYLVITNIISVAVALHF
jgi:hypothetical protein